MLGHSSLKFTKMAFHYLIRTSVFSSIEVKPNQMRKNNNEHKKIKQTYVISLCIIACQRIWSQIKRKKKTNMTSEWLSLQLEYIIFDWSSIASVSNSKWIIWIALYTVHSCYYLCSRFYSQCVWQHDITRHIYNVFFLEFLFLSCTALFIHSIRAIK